MKLRITISMLCIMCGVLVNAQEESNSKFNFDIGADLVSNYVWRGLEVDAAPNIQGWGEFSYGSLFAGLWASTNFTGTYNETDIYVGAALGNFTTTFTDYYAGLDNFFNVRRLETIHVGELMFQYQLPGKLPLQFSVAPLIYGSDLKLDYIDENDEPIFKDENNYSTYVEVMYPFSIKEADLEVALGGVTHESYYYVTDGPALINVSLKMSKTVKVTDAFGLPLSFKVSLNPQLEGVYSAFALSF